MQGVQSNYQLSQLLAVRVIKYLKVIASSETVLESPVNDVMQKWNNGNIIVNALLHSDGPFYDMVKDRMKNLNQTPQVVSAGHAYIAPKKVCRLTEFVEQSMSDGFDIFSYIQNFRPISCDPECLFSLCRLTNNYLQNRLTPANHSRNVFFNKNKHLIAPNSGS